MKNTKVSKVMLSAILGVSLLFGGGGISAEVEAPTDRTLDKGETQIELPSSALVFVDKQAQLEEIKAEGERLQKEREAEQRRIELEKARKAEEARLAKIEAERKAKEEAERKAREAERVRLAEIAEQKAKQQAQQTQVQSKQSQGIAFNGSYYTAHCSEGCTGVTATGVNVSNTIYYQGMRVIAVDTSVIPLYSIVQVDTPYESFKAIALDTGGAIKGHKVDILVADNATANKLGRHTVYITVLRSGK